MLPVSSILLIHITKYIQKAYTLVIDSSAFKWDWGFILLNIVIILIARALNSFPLCGMANFCRKEVIPYSYMLVIWFSGLRGAIAFALALNVWTPDPEHAGVIKSATLFTVIFTTLVSLVLYEVYVYSGD